MRGRYSGYGISAGFRSDFVVGSSLAAVSESDIEFLKIKLLTSKCSFLLINFPPQAFYIYHRKVRSEGNIEFFKIKLLTSKYFFLLINFPPSGSQERRG